MKEKEEKIELVEELDEKSWSFVEELYEESFKELVER